jgi:hypothetical protein
MKKIVTFSISILIVLSINAQNGKLFEYKKSKFGTYSVSPINKGAFRTDEIINEHAIIIDQEYTNSLFNEITQSVFSINKIEKIHTNSIVMLFFNRSGKILYCQFAIDSTDLNVITEEELGSIYNKFMTTKIDTSKINISYGNNLPSADIQDIAMLVGSLLPNKYLIKSRHTRIK